MGATKPYDRLIEIMKEATYYGHARPSKSVEWDSIGNLSKYLLDDVYREYREEGGEVLPIFKGLDNFYDVEEVEYQRLIKRLADRIRNLSRVELDLDQAKPDPSNPHKLPHAAGKLKDLIEIFKYALENNVQNHFGDRGKREEAIRQLDRERERILQWEKKRKYAKLPVNRQKLTHARPINKKEERSRASLFITNLLEEREAIYWQMVNLLKHEMEKEHAIIENGMEELQDYEVIPEFVSNLFLDFWGDEEELADWIVVRKNAPFLFKGDHRAAIFVILETPLSNDVKLIRFDSNDWQGVEEIGELDVEVFETMSLDSMEEAVAIIMDAINGDEELNESLFAHHDAEDYDTFDTFQDKIQQLLS